MPEPEYLKAVANLHTSLSDELLPYHELKEVLSALSGRLDATLAKKLQVRVYICGAHARVLGAVSIDNLDIMI